MKRDIKPIYTAPNPEAASAALEELEVKWGKKYSEAPQSLPPMALPWSRVELLLSQVASLWRLVVSAVWKTSIGIPATDVVTTGTMRRRVVSNSKQTLTVPGVRSSGVQAEP